MAIVRGFATVIGVLMFAAGVVGLLTGAIMTFVWLMQPEPGGRPTCDGTFMKRGDVCHVVIDGRLSSTGDYDEMQKRQDAAKSSALGSAIPLLGGGAVGLLGGWGLAHWANRN